MIIDRDECPWHDIPPQGDCASCGKPITDTKYVYWALFGDCSPLELHARCAARLSLHLASDALKADLPPKGAYQLGHPDHG